MEELMVTTRLDPAAGQAVRAFSARAGVLLAGHVAVLTPWCP